MGIGDILCVMNETLAAQLVGATKRFGKVVALDDVTLNVRSGEVLAVLGPNGAGKTTAVKLMLGLLRPDEGSARLFGHDPDDVSAKVRIGVMLQISGVPPTLTVREHIESFSVYYPTPLPIEEAIRIAGLREVANRPYGKLSGGQQQRLHFALAMVGDPDLLFLDEPTTGLDVESRRAFWGQVRTFLQNGRSVVLTTHHMEEADALADRIVLLDHGKLIAEGTPAQIKERAAGKIVRAITALSHAQLAELPGVTHVENVGASAQLLTSSAEETVRALLAADDSATGIEVTGASLEEAFLAFTSNRQYRQGAAA